MKITLKTLQGKQIPITVDENISVSASHLFLNHQLFNEKSLLILLSSSDKTTQRENLNRIKYAWRLEVDRLRQSYGLRRQTS